MDLLNAIKELIVSTLNGVRNLKDVPTPKLIAGITVVGITGVTVTDMLDKRKETKIDTVDDVLPIEENESPDEE